MTIAANMMNIPLLISSILRHAVENNPDQKIHTGLPDGSIHTYSYADFNRRVEMLAVGLAANGVQPGDRVGTLAWNTARHLEIYYATSGSGTVCHTINPRLHFEQIAFIINDADDQVVFYDTDITPLIESLRPLCPKVRHWVALQEGQGGGLADYDGWLVEAPADFAWPDLDENTAAGLCYTSGTTGNPKGALYSNRSTILHAYASCHPNAMNISRADTVLPVVPMFHVNAWGLPYSALLSGASLALPGPNLRGDALFKFCEETGVTMSAGVPTVWQGVLDYMKDSGQTLHSLNTIVIGGATCPPSMITAFAAHDVNVRHAWGMTEVSPLGTVCSLLPEHHELSKKEQLEILSAQGRPMYGIEIKLLDDDGAKVPNDGTSSGHLMVRGNWVIERYFGHDKTALDDGWFHTGDVASMDRNGYLRIRDRSKDLIKSGGEWISSIDIENIALEHPAVANAGCIAEPSEKWGERPLLYIVLREGHSASAKDILAIYDGRIANWWRPDRVEFIPEMPLTATGKIKKTALREILENS